LGKRKSGTDKYLFAYPANAFNAANADPPANAANAASSDLLPVSNDASRPLPRTVLPESNAHDASCSAAQFPASTLVFAAAATALAGPAAFSAAATEALPALCFSVFC
jgi:hypothetical protein